MTEPTDGQRKNHEESCFMMIHLVRKSGCNCKMPFPVVDNYFVVGKDQIHQTLVFHSAGCSMWN